MKLDARGLPFYAFEKRGKHDQLEKVVRSDDEGPLDLTGIADGLFRPQQDLYALQKIPERLTEPKGSGRGYHPLSGAGEQLVFELPTETSQGVARGGGAESEPLRGFLDALGVEKSVEDDEEVEVNGREMHEIELCHAVNALDTARSRP